MRALGITVAYIAVLMARMFADAWALLLMWGWFVVPLGAPSLTLFHALGLDLLVGMLLESAVPDQPEKPWGKMLESSVIRGLAIQVVVLGGWLIQGAM